MVARIKDIWLVQPYQHGIMDGCEGPRTFDSYEAACAEAEEWSGGIPYTDDHRHECVIFKAHTSYRGKISPTPHKIRQGEEPESSD